MNARVVAEKIYLLGMIFEPKTRVCYSAKVLLVRPETETVKFSGFLAFI